MNKFSHIQEALRFLSCCEITPKKEVAYQQILSMNKTCIGEKKYPIETTVRAFEYFSLARSAYNRIREDFELPSLRTLGRITSKYKSLDDTTYIRHIFSNLRDDRQKTCILLLDEVYVKPMLQYHGGIVFGKSANKPHLLANTVLSFLVVTLFNGPKFLYKMLPVRELDAEFLFAIQIKKTEKGKRVKLLTRDTANCLAQTCYGLVQLSKYLLDTTHQYILGWPSFLNFQIV